MLRFRRYTRQPNHWTITSRYSGFLLSCKHWPAPRAWRWHLKVGKFHVEWY